MKIDIFVNPKHWVLCCKVVFDLDFLLEPDQTKLNLSDSMNNFMCSDTVQKVKQKNNIYKK